MFRSANVPLAQRRPDMVDGRLMHIICLVDKAAPLDHSVKVMINRSESLLVTI